MYWSFDLPLIKRELRDGSFADVKEQTVIQSFMVSPTIILKSKKILREDAIDESSVIAWIA